MAQGDLEARGGMLWLHIYKDPECWGSTGCREPGWRRTDRGRMAMGRSKQVQMLSEDRAAGFSDSLRLGWEPCG